MYLHYISMFHHIYGALNLIFRSSVNMAYMSLKSVTNNTDLPTQAPSKCKYWHLLSTWIPADNVAPGSLQLHRREHYFLFKSPQTCKVHPGSPQHELVASLPGMKYVSTSCDRTNNVFWIVENNQLALFGILVSVNLLCVKTTGTYDRCDHTGDKKPTVWISALLHLRFSTVSGRWGPCTQGGGEKFAKLNTSTAAHPGNNV